MTDEEGVLGNLPRARLGQRSEKRPERGEAGTEEAAVDEAPQAKRGEAGSPAETSARAASRAERSGAKAARPAPGAEPRSRARAKPAAGPRRAAGTAAGEGRAAARGGDPVGDAVRAVTGVAATGARVAHGVAREVLRRLPRP